MYTLIKSFIDFLCVFECVFVICANSIVPPFKIFRPGIQIHIPFAFPLWIKPSFLTIMAVKKIKKIKQDIVYPSFES
jgi:hypothetical protein